MPQLLAINPVSKLIHKSNTRVGHVYVSILTLALAVCILPGQPLDWIANDVMFNVVYLIRGYANGYFTGQSLCFIASVSINTSLALRYFWRRRFHQSDSSATGLSDAIAGFNCIYLVSYLIRGCPDPDGWWPFLVFSLFYIGMLAISTRTLRPVYRMILAITTIECVIAILDYFCYSNQFFTPHFGRRTCGTYDSPNTLYALCILVVPVSHGLACAAENRTERICCHAVTVLSLIALLLTFQRAGWIAVAISMAYLAYSVRIPWAHMHTGKTVLLVLSCLLIVGAALIRTSGHIAGNTEDRSFWGRIAIWRVADRVFVHSPIFGNGQGGYSYQQAKFQDHALMLYNPRNMEPKSLYLSIAVDFGIIGLLAFGLLCYRYVRQAQMVGHCVGQFGALNIGINAAMIAILLAGIVDTPILDRSRVPSTVLVAIFLATVCKIRKTAEHGDKEPYHYIA